MKSAVLVIDVLNDFMSKEGTLYCGDRARGIIENVERQILVSRDKGDPVIFVCDQHHESDPEFEMFPPHCVTGTWGAQIIEELSRSGTDIVILKRRFSAFYGTDLDLTLRENGVDTLKIVGVCTNICVLYTAAGARMRHYRVVVPSDAVASFDENAHHFALKQMDEVLGVSVQ